MRNTRHFAMTAACVTAMAALVGFSVPAEARHLGLVEGTDLLAVA